MSLLNVDQEKCNRDGICIEVCPGRIIEFKNKDAFPTLVDGGKSVCINCGHCVAACPFGAMSHQAMQSRDCPPVQKELHLTAEQMEQFLRYRRSIRTYKGKPVEKSYLKRLIETARYAPTARNLQPVQWLVVYDPDEVQKLAGMVVDWMRHLIKEASPMAIAMNPQSNGS